MPSDVVKSSAERFARSKFWDHAVWIATTFRCHPTGEVPPVMGLVFVESDVGSKLFASWTDDWGPHDQDGAIRILFVEGDIEGQSLGYTVRISAKGSEERGQIQRMHPSADTEHLFEQFKAQYLQHGEYLLCPTVKKEDGQLWFDATKGIVKHEAVFRNAEDITKGDIDDVVLEVSPAEKALLEMQSALESQGEE